MGAAVLFTSLVAASSPARAELADLDTAMSTSGVAAYGLRGTLTYRNYSHFQATPTDDGSSYQEGILQVEWARRWTPLSRKLVGEIRGDTAGFAQGVPGTSGSATWRAPGWSAPSATRPRPRGRGVAVNGSLFAIVGRG